VGVKSFLDTKCRVPSTLVKSLPTQLLRNFDGKKFRLRELRLLVN